MVTHNPTALDWLRKAKFKIQGKWIPDPNTGLPQLKWKRESDPDNQIQAVYAFVTEYRILYVGKAAAKKGGLKGLAQRMRTYEKGSHKEGRHEQNMRSRITQKLKQSPISVWAHMPDEDDATVPYGDLPFGINIVAGLETTMINRFDPPWNAGSNKEEL